MLDGGTHRRRRHARAAAGFNTDLPREVYESQNKAGGAEQWLIIPKNAARADASARRRIVDAPGPGDPDCCSATIRQLLIITMICIIISAVVGILPAIYIETVTSYIEDGLTLGWDGVQGKILHALATMVGIYRGRAGVHGRLYAADGACDAGLPAQAAHADVRGDAEAAHPLL
ncbi:MAG: hypothetical protein ACLU3I_02910 [Acutalibacteraceae bacterium]